MPFHEGQELPLLQRYPLIETSSRLRMIEALRKEYGVRDVKIGNAGRPFVGIVNRADLGGVELHFASYSCDVTIDFSEMQGFRQPFSLGGAGRVRVGGHIYELSPSTTCIIRPFERFRAEYRGGYSQLVVVFSPEVLTKHVEYLTGLNGERTIALPTDYSLDVAKLDPLRDIALCLARQLDVPEGDRQSVVAHLKQALIASFLHEHHQSFSHLLTLQPKLVANRQVRLVEEFIEANWDADLSVETIAKMTGTSVRNVFATFKRVRGCTPMAFVRDIRLNHARRELEEPQEGRSVSDVALSCGFSSFGHFARQYREKFGELPSATLARNK